MLSENEGTLLGLNMDFGEKVGEPDCQLCLPRRR